VVIQRLTRWTNDVTLLRRACRRTAEVNRQQSVVTITCSHALRFSWLIGLVRKHTNT
jgi:hypothetical protein